MVWKCPECGVLNDASDCSCGYAFYKVLGIRADAPPEMVRQTHSYLINLWQEQSSSKDPLAKKKAEERLKKINAAYDVFQQQASITAKEKTGGRKPLYFAVPVIVIIAAIVIFVAIPKKDVSDEQPQVKTEQPRQQAAIPVTPDAKNTRAASSQPQSAEPPFPGQPENISPQIIAGEKNEEWAIESVKKSHVLDRFSDVDSLVKKWTEENAVKLKVLGWQAKKMDEEAYLVSYIASDGITTTGFYFDINTNTGNVRHVGDHPDLQQKYGIRYPK